MTARAARLAGTLAAVLAAGAFMAGCGGSTGVPGPPSAYLGTVVDRPVSAEIADLPLTTDAGRPTSLGAWHGQVVVLADFLTLCQETCPLTTGNLLVMDRAVMAAGLGQRVRFVELTVDPDRDTPARLRAYRALIGAPANMLLLTGRPAVIERIWRYLGVWYQRVGEDSPPGTDWLTGRPLTYDVDHEDALLYLDASGRVRFVVVGSPNASGAPVAPALLRFLSAQGRADLSHPDASTWTAAEALSPDRLADRAADPASRQLSRPTAGRRRSRAADGQAQGHRTGAGEVKGDGQARAGRQGRARLDRQGRGRGRRRAA